MPRFIVASFLTIFVWMLFGAPTEFNSRTILIFLAPIFSAWMIVWSDIIFKVFAADGYTYALAGKAMNMIGFLITLGSALWAFYVYAPIGNFLHIKVPALLWIGMTIGLFVPLCLPLASARSHSPLPVKGSRRDYEDPI